MIKLDNLFKIMSQKGISQAKLAESTSISTGNISDWKKGRSMPSAIKLDELATFFDCSVDYLLGRTDNPQSEPNTHIEQTHSFVQNDSSPILVVNPSNNQLDDIHRELLTYFDKLSFKDKAEIMKMVVDKAEC